MVHVAMLLRPFQGGTLPGREQVLHVLHGCENNNNKQQLQPCYNVSCSFVSTRGWKQDPPPKTTSQHALLPVVVALVLVLALVALVLVVVVVVVVGGGGVGVVVVAVVVVVVVVAVVVVVRSAKPLQNFYLEPLYILETKTAAPLLLFGTPPQKMLLSFPLETQSAAPLLFFDPLPPERHPKKNIKKQETNQDLSTTTTSPATNISPNLRPYTEQCPFEIPDLQHVTTMLGSCFCLNQKQQPAVLLVVDHIIYIISI